MKTCSKCGETKELSEFYFYTKPKKQFNRCKVCCNKEDKDYYKKNSAKILARISERRKDPDVRKSISERQRKYNSTEPGRAAVKRRDMTFKQRHPERNPIARKVQRALKSGKLVRPVACTLCGLVTPLVGHHEDYAKPLDVVWLCQKCHMRVHADKRAREAEMRDG